MKNSPSKERLTTYQFKKKKEELRKKYSEIAQNTIEIIKKGEYKINSKQINFKKEQEYSVKHNVVYPHNHSWDKFELKKHFENTFFQVNHCNNMDDILSIYNKEEIDEKKVALLNFANGCFFLKKNKNNIKNE